MRTFADCYRDGKAKISFELFPPRNEGAERNLERVLPELIALGPDFMTVTYGAFGSTQEKTLEVAARLRREFGQQTACHLTCVGASREELEPVIERIYGEGIRNIVALRGDPPKGEQAFAPTAGGFANANELVAFIREIEAERNWEGLGVAVAGYPEKHLEASDRESDLRNLKRKVDAGASVVFTQLFYENESYYSFVKAAREVGIDVPIVPGLLPIVSLKQLLPITGMCGATVPDALLHKLERAADDAQAQETIGVEHCVEQANDLLKNGVPGIHFYVLNRSSHIKRVMEGLDKQS